MSEKGMERSVRHVLPKGLRKIGTQRKKYCDYCGPEQIVVEILKDGSNPLIKGFKVQDRELKKPFTAVLDKSLYGIFGDILEECHKGKKLIYLEGVMWMNQDKELSYEVIYCEAFEEGKMYGGKVGILSV